LNINYLTSSIKYKILPLKFYHLGSGALEKRQRKKIKKTKYIPEVQNEDILN
jgi:hypothetical protein